MSVPTADFDSPWKVALEEYLPDFLALFFPKVYALIDWSRPHEFLDQELQQVVRDAELGRRLADKLVRVWLLDGTDLWVLIHIEVQGRYEAEFAERMFTYYYRMHDRHRRPVISLAALVDDRTGWRPDSYLLALGGCSLAFHFPVAKLLDWRERQTELEASDNPFATVALAHLMALATRRDVVGREAAKLGLLRRLYEQGYDRERVLRLFTFIDWLLALPAEHEQRIQQAIAALEEEHHMPYITTVERRAIQQGRLVGLQQAARTALEGRFGTLDAALLERLADADEPALLDLLAHIADELPQVRSRLGLV